MAKVLAFYDGGSKSAEWGEMPLADAIRLFELLSADSRYSRSRPSFGDPSQVRWFAGPRHVVVEVDETDDPRPPWRAGYYVSPVSPDAAFHRLIRRALVPALGEQNVLDVKITPTIDYLGESALLVTVVIPPDAAERLGGDAAIDASASLRAQFHAMRDDRTPIIQYATTAELAEDVDS